MVDPAGTSVANKPITETPPTLKVISALSKKLAVVELFIVIVVVPRPSITRVFAGIPSEATISIGTSTPSFGEEIVLFVIPIFQFLK